ncbi:histidine kinase [Kibdelosporangium lantanae]
MPALTTSTKDALLAAGLTVMALVPQLGVVSAQIGDLPERPVDVPFVALTVALCVPLAVRVRWPVACLAVVGVAFALHEALAYPPTVGTIGFYLAIYAAGAHQRRFRLVTGVVGTAGYVALAFTLHALGSPNRIRDFALFFLVLVVIWMVGDGVRRWRAGEAERRQLHADKATTTERARIARELHDVVTHHVTAMVVQADAAQFLVSDAPERAADGLNAISVTGRRALTELRELLGVLEATGESVPSPRTPTLGRVVDLVEQARFAGQPVELVEEGDQRPRGVEVELAAYRVVQESLTNALKHATGHPTTVRVRHGVDDVEIEVTTESPTAMPPAGRRPAGGPGTASATSPATLPATPSGGRGLTGLRERVRMVSGSFDAGSRPDGGFAVRAVLPTGGDA